MAAQDWIDNPINTTPKSKTKEQPKEQPKGIPEWARSAGNQYMKWFKGHKDNDMCKKMLNMMTKPAHHHGTELKATLDREIALIKAIQQFNGIREIEKKQKIGWSEEDFTVWLFLEFEGKVKMTAGVRPSDKPVHVRAAVFMKVDEIEWARDKKHTKFKEVKFILEEVLFREQTGKWLAAPKEN